jgi:hypothetical protein
VVSEAGCRSVNYHAAVVALEEQIVLTQQAQQTNKPTTKQRCDERKIDR